VAVRRARSKIPALVEALDGTFTEHSRSCAGITWTRSTTSPPWPTSWTLGSPRCWPGWSATRTSRTSTRFPGIGPAAAQIIIAETGGDMARFATPGHLASWIGVCPGMNESAGVTKSGRTRPGNSNLKRLQGIAAVPVTRNNDCCLSAYYRRIAARRDRQRTLVAAMRKLAIAIWHVLRHSTCYQDLDTDYFTRRDPERPCGAWPRKSTASDSPSALNPSQWPESHTHPIFRVRVRVLRLARQHVPTCSRTCNAGGAGT
jgi:transposase